MTPEAEEVLTFWFGAGADARAVAAEKSALWWGSSEDVDEEVRRRFGGLVAAARRGELDDWASEPRSRLALVILLDQFPRNAFRGMPDAFSGDARALALCKDALAAGADAALRPIERVFLYLPLEHSENLADQNECVRLYEALAAAAPEEERPLFEEYAGYGRAHRDVVARFGRFPHRNAILGRESTPEEVAFLKQPGSSF